MVTNGHNKDADDEFNSEKRMELLQMGQAVNLLGSWEWDLHTDQLLWTDAMFQLRATPISTDNLISFEETVEFIHPDDKDMVLEKFELAKKKTEVEFEYRIVTTEGETKLISAWITAFKDENGEPRYLRGTSQDITRQRNAENQLLELNQQFKHAEEIAKTGNWKYDVESKKFTFSENLYRLFGCEPFAFEPSLENLLPYIHIDDKDKLVDQLGLLHNAEETSTHEFRITRKDGGKACLKNISKVFVNKGSKIILGTLQDITEEALLRKELEERKLFAEMLFDNSIDLIAAFNTNLEIVAWNKTCEERYTLRKEEVLGKHITEVYPHLENDSRLQDIQEALQGNIVHRDSKHSHVVEGYFESFLLPLKTANGEIIGVLSIAHDLSEIKEATIRLDELNQSLEQKNYELERSNNELASFSYVASHDLQEPLRKIQTFSQRIMETEFGGLSTQGKDYFKRMEGAARRMQNLIEDLLTFSRTNTTLKKLEPVDLNVLLEEVKVSLKDRIEEKHAVIESNTLPVVNIIPFQFRQMLENLLLNAIKYSKPDVSPIVKITAEVFSGANIKLNVGESKRTYHKISIADNGIGFEQQYAEKIFELFQRLHGKHEYPGTGLGLAICRKVIQNHNGYITAVGELGKGATFIIYLPA